MGSTRRQRTVELESSWSSPAPRLGVWPQIALAAPLRALFRPRNVPCPLQANPTDGVALSLTVFNNSVDVPGELTKLARSWPVGKPVGLATLQFAVRGVLFFRGLVPGCSLVVEPRMSSPLHGIHGCAAQEL